MSPAKADAPLRKVTLNLYEEDCALLEQYYGHGWSQKVRELIHGHTFQWRQRSRTIGDLAND